MSAWKNVRPCTGTEAICTSLKNDDRRKACIHTCNSAFMIRMSLYKYICVEYMCPHVCVCICLCL